MRFGLAVGWVYGNGRTLSRQHDLDYRPATIQDNASGGPSLHYGYDAAGQLTELQDGLQSAFLARYDYDNLGRLTILRDGPSGTPIETYTYDATGNRTSLLHGGVTTNIAVTYLGGYNARYQISGSALHVQVTNSSNIQSATHPPVLGYTRWWAENVGERLDSWRATGPMSEVTQTSDLSNDLSECLCRKN